MAELKPITPEDLAQADSSQDSPQGGAYIPDRLRVDNTPAAKDGAGSYALSGICSIVTFILIVVAFAIIKMDHSELSRWVIR